MKFKKWVKRIRNWGGNQAVHRCYNIPPHTNLGQVSIVSDLPENVQIAAANIGHTEPGSVFVKIKQRGQTTISISEGVTIREGVAIHTQGSGTISIGRNTVINESSSFKTSGRSSIYIGEDCAISWNCHAVSNDFHVIQYNNEDAPFEKDILIGNHVWIGMGVLILKGTIIGDQSVVAAGSVLTKAYPPNTLIAGNPGQVVKTNVTWRNLTPSEKQGIL